MQTPKKEGQKELKYTCLSTQSNSGILLAGLSNGSIQLIDCAQGKVWQTIRK
jgi:hypothetical protein